MTSHPTEPPLLETLSVVDCVLRQLGRRLPAHVSREDLASAGKVALVEALMRFDGLAHEAQPYCHTRVRGAMLDELRRLDPLSRRTRTRVNPVNRATTELTGRLGREPADFEVAAETGLTIGAVREANRFATVDEIAADLGVSRERARQIRVAGEKHLRADFVVLALWQSLMAWR